MSVQSVSQRRILELLKKRRRLYTVYTLIKRHVTCVAWTALLVSMVTGHETGCGVHWLSGKLAGDHEK